jgi:hypothetical protein
LIKVITIKDITRKDIPLYYRSLYTGVAVIEISKNSADYHIDFAIEIKPTGNKEISVSFLDTIDYPLLPIIKEIREFINNLDYAGGLPD